MLSSCKINLPHLPSISAGSVFFHQLDAKVPALKKNTIFSVHTGTFSVEQGLRVPWCLAVADVVILSSKIFYTEDTMVFKRLCSHLYPKHVCETNRQNSGFKSPTKIVAKSGQHDNSGFFYSSCWSGIHSGFKRSDLKRGQLRGGGRIPSLHLSHQEGTHS